MKTNLNVITQKLTLKLKCALSQYSYAVFMTLLVENETW